MNVCVGATTGVEVYVVPYHVKLLQANAVVSPVLLWPTVKCKVTTLSQPEAFVNVCVGATAGVDVYVVPYHVKLLQAKAVVSPVLLWPTVKCKVTTLSQPLAFVNVCVGAMAGVDVYVVPYHVKLLQANAVVSPVLLWPTVKCSVTKESQPSTFLSMRIGATAGVSVYVVPYHVKLLQA